MGWTRQLNSYLPGTLGLGYMWQSCDLMHLSEKQTLTCLLQCQIRTILCLSFLFFCTRPAFLEFYLRISTSSSMFCVTMTIFPDPLSMTILPFYPDPLLNDYFIQTFLHYRFALIILPWPSPPWLVYLDLPPWPFCPDPLLYNRFALKPSPAIVLFTIENTDNCWLFLIPVTIYLL